MTVQPAPVDDVDALLSAAADVRAKVRPAGYSYCSADTGGTARRDGHWADGGMARVPPPSEERRKVRRYEQRLPLTMSVFNRSALFQAQMVNYSQDGVCAETCHRILPGTSIHLRMDAYPAAAGGRAVRSEFRTTALGEVKWCRSRGQGLAQRFLIGIRYYSYY